jgi:long-chain acyl-CoA synthetase
LTRDALPQLSDRIAGVLALDPSAAALEFEHRWYRWGDLAAAAAAIEPHVAPGERVAVLLRNRPAHVGLLLGLLRAGACVVTANPERGIERVRADLESLGVGTVAGARTDLDQLAPAVRWLSSDALGAVDVTGDAPAGEMRPRVAVEMLTSGTTGPPKRVPLTYATLSRVLDGAKHYERNQDAKLRLRSGVVIVNSPLVHLGGLFRILQCVNDGRSFCLLERFRVDEWADAVRRHRPRTVSLVPAALRMVLEADLDPADLTSVRSVISGTAPLAPEDAEAFREKYGAPVLISYAATEFGGGIAGWNLADHERFWATKRGSVGRAHPGCELRVVAPDTGAPLGTDEEGLLEVKTRQLGDESGWTRTTDLARIDADGFLWILGRADQAIIRGGFKIRPEDVRAALERDPRVRGAAVVSRADARLGAVPVAAVELRPGVPPVAPEDLLEEASNVLARYELPDELRLVDALPRTPAGKVDLAAVRELFMAGH